MCQLDLRFLRGSPIRFSLGLWHVLWSVGTNVLEDIAACSIKVEVTSVSMQLLPLVAFSNYISRRLTNLQRSGICAYKIHQAATPQRIYGQECPLQKFLPNHIFFFFCRIRDQWGKHAALLHRVQQYTKHRQQRYYQWIRRVYRWTALISVLVNESCGDLHRRKLTTIP